MDDASGSEDSGSSDYEAAARGKGGANGYCGVGSASSVRSPAVARPNAKERLALPDNAKFVLTIWVCWDHLFGPCHAFAGHWLVSTVMMFMMPGWTFISGYFSARDFSRPKSLDGILKAMAIYFLAQGFWLALSRYGGRLWSTTWWGKMMDAQGYLYSHSEWKIADWVVPYWQLWYLRDLILWRLALPFWWRLEYPVTCAWVFCSLFVTFKFYHGTFDHGGWFLDVNQTVAWFPLFCLGARAKEADWQPWQHPWRVAVGGLVLVAMFWPIWWTSEAAIGDVWRYTGNLDVVDEWTGDNFKGRFLKFLMRLGVPVYHAVCIWAFMQLVPHGRGVLTQHGERALAAYIFHPLTGLLFSALGFYGPMRDDWGAEACPAWGEPLIYVLVIPATFFWCSKLVWRVVWPICDPPVHLLLRPA